MQLHKYIYLVFTMVVLSGCTTGRDLVRDDMVRIQRIDSQYAYIKSVSIKQSEGVDKPIYMFERLYDCFSGFCGTLVLVVEIFSSCCG